MVEGAIGGSGGPQGLSISQGAQYTAMTGFNIGRRYAESDARVVLMMSRSDEQVTIVQDSDVVVTE